MTFDVNATAVDDLAVSDGTRDNLTGDSMAASTSCRDACGLVNVVCLIWRRCGAELAQLIGAFIGVMLTRAHPDSGAVCCCHGSTDPAVRSLGRCAVCCCCYASRRGLLGWVFTAMMPCPQAHQRASPQAPYTRTYRGDKSQQQESAARRRQPPSERQRSSSASAKPAPRRSHRHRGKHASQEPSRSLSRRHSSSSDGAVTSSSEETSRCDSRSLRKAPPFPVDSYKGGVQNAPRAQPHQPMHRRSRSGRRRAASGHHGDSVSIDLAKADAGKREGRARPRSGEAGGHQHLGTHAAMKPGRARRGESGSGRQQSGSTPRDWRHHRRRHNSNRSKRGHHSGKADAGSSRGAQRGGSSGASRQRQSSEAEEQ